MDSGLIAYVTLAISIAGTLAWLVFYWRWLRSRQIRWKRFRNGFSLDDLGELKAKGKLSAEEFERLTVSISKPAPTLVTSLRPRFCPDCGQDLRAMPDRCPQCGLVFSSRT